MAEMKLILYFADGFSWQYVEEGGFMDGEWDARVPLTTLLGYSSTIIPSILTGKLPRDTGLWTEYYFDPRDPSALSRLLSRRRLKWLLPPVNLLRLVWFRIARKVGLGWEHRLRIPLELSHMFARHDIHYDRFPPIGLPVATLADLFSKRGMKVHYRYLADGPTKTTIADALADTDCDVYFFSDSSLDHRGHRMGASAERLAPSINKITGFLERLWSVLPGDDIETILFSDHGMTDVAEVYDLFSALEPWRLGRDYLVFMDSTMARFWFSDLTVKAGIMEALSGAPGRFLTTGDKHELGIDFEDDLYEQETLAADEGVVFHPNYFAGPFIRWARKYPELAMHGYLPEAPSSRGVFCYRGDRWSAAVPEPFSPTDIFSVVEAITKPAMNSTAD